MKKHAIAILTSLGGLSIPSLAFAQASADEMPPASEAEPMVQETPEAQDPKEEEQAPAPAPVAAEETSSEAEVASTEPAAAASEETAPEKKKGYLDPKFNIGTGLRVSYTLDPNVPDENFGQSIGTNIRPYLNGQISEHIKFEANLDSATQIAGGDPVSTIRVLDAVVKIEAHPLVNFWIGRFLPPSDRANLSGPYFQNSWNYPVAANLFPAIYAGRHDGAAYWGQVGEGVFKWQLGVFDMTQDDNPLLAGRLVLNLLDPEGGYYNSSTYYGSKDVLAIGATAQYQNGGDTATGSGIDGLAAEVEILFEKELNGSGTITAEAEYYNFTDTDQGQSVVGLVSYLLPGKQGIGTLQPNVRMQLAIPDAGDTYPTIDAAVNYIVDGHNCRFTLNYQHIGGHDGVDADDLITLGGQIQVF